MSYETRYAALKHQQQDATASSPEAVAWRIRDRAIRERARHEMEERFYPLADPAQAAAALAWCEARIAELHAGS